MICGKKFLEVGYQPALFKYICVTKSYLLAEEMEHMKAAPLQPKGIEISKFSYSSSGDSSGVDPFSRGTI